MSNLTKDEVIKVNKLGISARLSLRYQKTSLNPLLEDRPDLLDGVDWRRGLGHEAYFQSQFSHHGSSLLGIVSLVVIADQKGSPQTSIF